MDAILYGFNFTIGALAELTLIVIIFGLVLLALNRGGH